MKPIIYFLLSLIVIFTSCSKVDNYSAPDSSIYGTIIDSTTNEPIQTDATNGIKINLYETSYVTPIVISTWTKADGTFENANLFGNTYKVIPSLGAFVSADTLVVTINGRTQVSFRVMPYLTVKAEVSAGSNFAIANYTISRSVVTSSIVLCETLCSRVPNVSATNAVYEYSVIHDLSSMTAPVILAKQFSDTIKGLTSGLTYYIRVGARTNNTNKKFNYSPVYKVIIP